MSFLLWHRLRAREFIGLRDGDFFEIIAVLLKHVLIEKKEFFDVLYDDGENDVVFSLAGFDSPGVFLLLEVIDDFDFLSGGGILEVDVEEIQVIADFLEIRDDAIMFDNPCFF